MSTELQKKMFQEFADREIFEAAKQSAFDYAAGVMARRVYPTPEAIAQLEHFVEKFPDQGSRGLEIVRQLHRDGSPATVTSLGGRYFGLVVGSSIPAALAARWLADFWDQNTALYHMSPISAKLEEVCEDWLRDIFNLPKETVAGFVSGSSTAILCGLAAGRYRVFQNQGWDINAKGFGGAPRIRIVTGRQTHSTVVKMVALLGLGVDNVEWAEVDAQGRIIADRLPRLDRSTILILQAGNVNSGSYDPFPELCRMAKAAGAWVHIDGAFGLWAAASRKLSALTAGIEEADSWSVDGHKTLNTPYDSGIVLCRDKPALVSALQASGAYMVYSKNRDGMLYTPEMSRRARATELWAALKFLGRQGTEELIDGLHERAVQMSAELRREGFEVLNDVVFNQILVACGSDPLTEKVIEQIQESGECWAGGSKWFGRAVIRVSVCSWATTAEDITRSVRAFVEARRRAGS